MVKFFAHSGILLIVLKCSTHELQSILTENMQEIWIILLMQVQFLLLWK
jgi:hypothetical protein